MRKVQHLAISGHNAYCGMLGRPMLDVPLAGGKILNVTAPCGIAQALAAKRCRACGVRGRRPPRSRGRAPACLEVPGAVDLSRG